jgi:hypothetical protein
MNAAIVELKTRARLGLNALRRGELELVERARAVSGTSHAVPSQWRLRQVFTLVSRSVGFSNWEQARRVLGAQASRGDDMGTFWHAPRCHGLLNHWFAQHADAQACLRDLPDAVLLPCRRQFVVAGPPYLAELGLSRDEPAWAACERDLAAGATAARPGCGCACCVSPRRRPPGCHRSAGGRRYRSRPAARRRDRCAPSRRAGWPWPVHSRRAPPCRG